MVTSGEDSVAAAGVEVKILAVEVGFNRKTEWDLQHQK